jgi:UDP-N-acetylglucosamine acyltransferase
MPEVHPTAILEGEIELGPDVRIGPYCVLTGPLELGARTRLLAGAYLHGPLQMGEDNLIYPGACIGFAPQMLGFDPAKTGPGVRIGHRNTFREGATIHRSLTDASPTRVGSDCYFMANSHAGHDCFVGDHCVLANGALLGGHVRLDDHVIVGGNAAIHQHCRVGRGAMLSGGMAASRDVPPFFMLTGFNLAGAINLVGMRRAGMPRSQIDDVRWVYKTLYRKGLGPKAALEALRERLDRPIVTEYVSFLETSERGIVPARADPRRGSDVSE